MLRCLPQLTNCTGGRPTKKTKGVTTKAKPEGLGKSHITTLQLPMAHTDDRSASEAETVVEQQGEEEAT